MKSRIRFAIDAGSGFINAKGERKNSATGVCVYDPIADKILEAFEVRTMIIAPTWDRIRDLGKTIRRHLQRIEDIYGPLEVRIEVFVMKGVSAEVLYRLTGAYIAAIPAKSTFVEIHNITLKKDLTGDGKADKRAIAAALLKRFPAQVDIIQNLIDNKNEDALDAVAIAVCREVK